MSNSGLREQVKNDQPQETSSSCCLAKLFPCISSVSTTESIRVAATSTRGSNPASESVYYTAANEGNGLNPDELQALKDLEEAVNVYISSRSRRSVYYDASDHVKDDWEYLIEYMPATKANKHERGSVVMSSPDTLLAMPSSQKMSSFVVRRRLSSIIGVLQQPVVKIDMPGYPGELNEDEVAACLRFRQELEKKESSSDAENGKYYREMVDAFHSVEEEPYALCRFLRARKFDTDAAIAMIDDGVDVWAEGKKHNFFPDANVAIGNPLSVLRTQYPVTYEGIAKNGCPVSYFMAGRVSVEGLECVTTLDKLSNLAWHQMMYTFPKNIAKAQATNPDAVRCEAVAVIDLEGLKASALNVRTLEVLKSMATVSLGAVDCVSNIYSLYAFTTHISYIPS